MLKRFIFTVCRPDQLQRHSGIRERLAHYCWNGAVVGPAYELLASQ